VRLTYDPDVNVAYLQVADAIGDGEAAIQHHSIATPKGDGELIVDYDADGRLLGIEILQADRVLLPDVLLRAERT
jgi:YD repeat-containing protein